MSASDGPSDTSLRRLTPSHYVEFSRLGEGSMGLVYLALDTELNRRVAFKMIRPLAEAEDTEPLEATPSPEDESFPEMKARFLQEAWVTGGLEHPGIVPVYELGETTGGIPYYTMRVVRGEKTLADAIEQAQGLDGRLALLEPFLKICDTVRYAHARGVIHRDLKPANIALGDYGETVVLDWGLAKLKDRPDLARSVWQQRIEELRDETDLHTLASAIGTPGYMSPEAALVEIDKVDARSDVYSLGAILYRILTGKLPYEFQSYPELVQKLTGEVPRDPSEVDAAVPAGLSRICLKALSAKRAERYADADEVAAAIRAWQRESALEREVAALLREAESALETAPNLAGEARLRQVDRVTAVCARVLELRPGEARAEALQAKGHQLRERAIVERERGARKRLLKRVAVIGLAVATAATVLVALLLEAKRREAEEARTREAAARARAEEERARAEDLSNFMLFDLRDGLLPLGRLDLLAKVARKAQEYYESLPSEGATADTLYARSMAFENVGHVLEEEGDLPAALRSFERCLSIRKRLPEKRKLAVAVERIGNIRASQGNLDAALRNYRESLSIRQSLVAAEPSDAHAQRGLSVTLEWVGRLLHAQGDPAGALEHLRESLAIRRRLAAQDPDNVIWQGDLASSLTNVGELLRAQGKPAEALEHHRASLAIHERLVESDPGNAEARDGVSIALEKIGDILLERGDLPAALKSFRASLAIAQELADQDPTNMSMQYGASIMLKKVGRMLMETEDPDGALEYCREALAVTRGLVERDPTNLTWQRDLAVSLNMVGEPLRMKDDWTGALEVFQEALDINRRLVARDPTDFRWLHGLAVSLVKVGEVRHAKGDPAGALESFRECAAIDRRLTERDPKNPVWQHSLTVTLEKTGEVQEAQEDWAGAAESYGEGVAIGRRLAGLDPANASWQRSLAVALCKLGRVRFTQGMLPEALRALREAEEAHGRAVKLAPRLADEHDFFKGWCRRVALVAGEISPETAEDHLVLARALCQRKEFGRASRSFATAFEDSTIRTDLARGNLYHAACAAARAGDREQALAWLREDLRLRRDTGQDEAVRRAHVERARKDPDFVSLRGSREFEELLR